MTIENINNEIIIRIPQNLDFHFLQQFIDYINAKTIVSKSEAKDEEINELTEEIQANWWAKNKQLFIK